LDRQKVTFIHSNKGAAATQNGSKKGKVSTFLALGVVPVDCAVVWFSLVGYSSNRPETHQYCWQSGGFLWVLQNLGWLQFQESRCGTSS
jgi:hypothetical protein